MHCSKGMKDGPRSGTAMRIGGGGGSFRTGRGANPASARAVSEKRKPPPLSRRGLRFRTLAVTYSRMAAATLSSARSVFTSEFEMGSGGSRSLLPPGNSVQRAADLRRTPNPEKFLCFDAQVERLTLRTWTMPHSPCECSIRHHFKPDCLKLYGQVSRAISTG